MKAGPRFLLDENIHLAVAEGLRRLGFDTVHVREIGCLGASDHQVLVRAAGQNRLVVTRDLRDFARLATLYQGGGKALPGILILSHSFSSRDPGSVIRALASWASRRWDRDSLPGGIAWLGPADDREGPGGRIRERAPAYEAALDRLAALARLGE